MVEKEGIQRVRIGLMGLACVFLLVLLAAVFTRATDEEPITASTIERFQDGSAPSVKPEPKEPLAELGVAPGMAESNSQE